jgi:hypothetical protein
MFSMRSSGAGCVARNETGRFEFFPAIRSQARMPPSTEKPAAAA